MCLCMNADERQFVPFSKSINVVGDKDCVFSPIVFPSYSQTEDISLADLISQKEWDSNCYLKWVRLSVTNLKCTSTRAGVSVQLLPSRQ